MRERRRKTGVPVSEKTKKELFSSPLPPPPPRLRVGSFPGSLPKIVRVGAIDYAVILVNRSAIRADGICDYGASKIKIDRGLSDQEKMLTLWHEIMHAVTYEVSVKISEDDNDRIARLLFSVVRDNPGLKENPNRTRRSGGR